MRCLIRHLIHRGKAEAAYKDSEFEGEVLTIGRATDQDLFLADMRVALKHAAITQVGQKRFKVQSMALSGIRVNGLLTQGAFVQVGDRIGIGATELLLTNPPEGFDLAVQVEKIPVKDFAAAYRAKFKLDLASTGLRKRPWSWLLFVSVLVLFLVIPMGRVIYHDSLPVLSVVEHLPLPSDQIWLTGKLAAAHQFFGTDCQTCHQQPFVMVRDQACISCHTNTAHHTDPEFQDLKALSQTRCATCHKEHYGEHALVRLDPDLCADCHRNLSELVAKELNQQTDLRDAGDFGSQHPQFRATLISLDLDGVEQQRRVSIDDQEQLRERSNLKFSHEEHLRAEGINSPEGRRQLDCHHCHTPEPGGAKMRPVDMETMCQDCHRLSFEPGDPQRQVPHGKVAETLYTLQEYYALRALRGGYVDAQAPERVPEVVRRYRPTGTSLSQQQQLIALGWARQKAQEVGREIFKARLCATCHQVTEVSGESSSWQVLPARVSTVWFPKANFTHDKHKTERCDRCHAADISQASEDVLIPGIENCRECHGGVKAKTKLTSTCVDCHGFHISRRFLLSDRVQLQKE